MKDSEGSVTSHASKIALWFTLFQGELLISKKLEQQATDLFH